MFVTDLETFILFIGICFSSHKERYVTTLDQPCTENQMKTFFSISLFQKCVQVIAFLEKSIKKTVCILDIAVFQFIPVIHGLDSLNYNII